MTELMPPFGFNNLILVNLVDRPKLPIGLVEKDALKDMILVRDGGDLDPVVHSELMLVVGAIERHLDLPGRFRVGLGVVHRSESTGFLVLVGRLAFGKGDLVFLRFVLGWRAQVRVEAGLVVFLEIRAVGMCDGDVVEESCAAEHEFLSPANGLAEELLGVVGEHR